MSRTSTRRLAQALPCLEGMEDRLAPTTVGNLILNPGVIRGFNPQPEPPAYQLIRQTSGVQVIFTSAGANAIAGNVATSDLVFLAGGLSGR